MNKARVGLGCSGPVSIQAQEGPWAFEADGRAFWQWRLVEREAQWDSTAAGLPCSGCFHSAGSLDSRSSGGGSLTLGSLGSSFKGKCSWALCWALAH